MLLYGIHVAIAYPQVTIMLYRKDTPLTYRYIRTRAPYNPEYTPDSYRSLILVSIKAFGSRIYRAFPGR